MEQVKSSEQEKEEAGKGQKLQLIVFKLGGEEYALPIEQIKEVVLTPRISKVPHTPDFIKGLANIRGNLISILDLEKKFNLNETIPQDGGMNFTLVIESEVYKAGVLVKELPNTLSVSNEQIDNTSNIIQYSSMDKDCINGIAKVGERTIILVDMFKMLETNEIKEIINQNQDHE